MDRTGLLSRSMERSGRWPIMSCPDKEVSNEEVCAITPARVGVQHDGMGVSRGHVPFKLVHERELHVELGSVSKPMPPAVADALPATQSVPDPKPVPGPRSVPKSQSMPGSRSVPQPLSESVPLPVFRAELVLVVALGQLWLRLVPKRHLPQRELRPLRLDTVIPNRQSQDSTWVKTCENHVRSGGGLRNPSTAGAGRAEGAIRSPSLPYTQRERAVVGPLSGRRVGDRNETPVSHAA